MTEERTNERTKPIDCTTMAEVRRGVDRLDEEIAALLAERFRYMEAAARIKPDREAVRDDWRKAAVIAKVSSAAAREGGPAARIALISPALFANPLAEFGHEWGR